MGYALRNMQIHMQYFILNPNPQNRSRILNEFSSLESQFQDYRQLVRQDARFDVNLVDDYLGFLDEQLSFYSSLVNLIEANNIDSAREQWRSSIADLRLNSDLEKLQEFRSGEQDIYLEKKQEQDFAIQKIPSLIWMVTLISTVVSMILGYLIISFLLSRLNEEALVLATSATQIAGAMEQQDQSSSEQAIAVNETTTTIEQLKTSAQQSATQAESAAASVRQVLALALGEWQQTNEAAAASAHSQVSLKVTSNQISEQVQTLIQQLDQIYGITNLLADLAAQTNMLALNASVEAVHAGEQGRGFSVIAKEIRKLADDSRSSAQKISHLIADIQRSASATLKSTESGTHAVDLISSAINEISINVQQISLNAREQANGISQIMSAMTEINGGIQQTATHIRQTKEGTQQLNETAQKLNRLV